MTAKYTLKPTGKRKHRRDSMMSKTEVMLVMIPFHGSGYRCFIETVNDELKNIAQVEHSRHRCFDNFIVNLLVMSEKVCKILLVLALMLGVPQAWGKFVMLIYLCHFT